MQVGDLVTGRINSDNRVGIIVGHATQIGSAWLLVRWSSGKEETINKRSVKVIS